jgi:hypothetical protein
MPEDQERTLDELLKKLPPEDAKAMVKALANITQAMVDKSLTQLKKDLAPDILRLIQGMMGHSDAVIAEVADLENKTGDTREDVLLKALSLYEAALEAKQKGQRLVVVGPDYRFIREIVGFDRAGREPAQSRNHAS